MNGDDDSFGSVKVIPGNLHPSQPHQHLEYPSNHSGMPTRPRTSTGMNSDQSYVLTSKRPRRTPSFNDFPREVVRTIATHIYDPLELTQQDRLSELIIRFRKVYPIV
jgi:hypothetical protein